MFRRKPKPQEQPEWLIVGLGNPGAEYRGTRHNVGFDTIDLLSETYRIKLDKGRHRSRCGAGTVGGVPVLLLKPLTYMNLSGQAVAPMARQLGIKPDRILVIADELALPLGKLRLRESGSPAGHNGHKSLIQYLGTQDYPRIRIGIGGAAKGEAVDHVLGGFDREERATIDEAIRAAAETCATLLQSGPQAAQLIVDAHNKAGQRE